MDVIIFSGQSNMQGSTAQKGSYRAENCLEYKFLTDQFVSVVDPVGEDIGDKLLCAPARGCGSLVPSFCKAYAKKKGSAIAIHCAKGNTSISEWKKGTERYSALVEKARKGIIRAKENFEVDKVYFVWLQGESDALNKNTEDGYLESLVQLKNDLKDDLKIDKFGIIKVGYFAEFVPWKPDANRENDETIMLAQERAAKEDKDFIILTDICAKLSRKSKCLNPQEHGPHYNNKALALIGKKAGKTLSKIK